MVVRFQEPIKQDLERFNDLYREILHSGHWKIDLVVTYLMKTRGKGIRPTLSLLCGRLGDRPPDDTGIRAAVIVEMLHEATLVHDDVVDDSSERRGFPSLPAKFKNKISVLFGDYMLSSVLAQTVELHDFRWLQILSETAKRMSRGELLGAARTKRFDLTEADYLAIIGDKTAALFNASCKLGGYAGGVPDELVIELGNYGESIGMMFQIRDDLLDLFGEGDWIGKPVGGDLKEKKITLPVLAALKEADKRSGSRIKARIRRGVKADDIKIIAEFVREHHGDEYCRKMMMGYREGAIAALSRFPDSPIRSILTEVADFVILRGG